MRHLLKGSSHRADATCPCGDAREFSFCRHSEVASSLAILQVAEEGGFGERFPASSSLGSSPLVVVDDGPDADEQAVGKTSCPDDAHILEAWYDEHGLRNRSWSRWLVVRSRAFLMTIPVCKFYISGKSAVELGVVMLRIGGSLRGWFDEFVTENNLELGPQGL